MLSIIVPARNNPVLTRDCISSAIHSLDKLRLTCEFILIDDASDSSEGIAPLFRETRTRSANHQFIIARARKHLHYTGVFSLGIHLSRGERIFFLSNDMLITPYFFAAVLGVAALDSKIGIVRGTSNHTDSHPEHTVVPPKSVMQSYEDVQRFSRERFEIGGLGLVEDKILSGDAVLISRLLVEHIGVLDLRFFGYFGDVDFGMRAHLAGYKLVCAKGAWLLHQGAGHLKAEAKALNVELSALVARRMELVQTAYDAFRKKWDESLPTNFSAYTKHEVPAFFPIAEKNAARVELKYNMPPAVLQEVDLL